MTITVKDAQNNTPIGGAHVLIELNGNSYTASADKDGIAVFEGVPAGRAALIEAQELDYDIAQISNPMIPGRQRVRFTLPMSANPGERIYIGHDTGQSTI